MKTAEFFRNRKVRRAAVVLACIVLVYGGLRLYGWAEPRIYYASLDRQEWREDMEPGEYFPPVPPDAKGPPRSMEMWHYLPDSSRWVDSEHIRKMIDRGDLLDMREFEPEISVSYSGGSIHTYTLFWMKEDSVMALKASQVSSASKYDDEGGQFIPTYPVEIVRRPLITCREGVDIICAGGEDEEKVMRFYRDETWYQILGEEEISYEEMVRVLDYYFANPLHFY